jgi:fatty-acyl-CoA synthase
VAVLSPNSHRVLEAFFAVPQLGAVLLPLNFRLTTPEFAYIIEHAEAKVALVDWELPTSSCHWWARSRASSITSYCGILKSQPASLPAQDYETILAATSPEFRQPVEVAETDIATLNYTSGTTARPKGVMLTHRACVMSSLNYITALNVLPDRCLSAHPADVSCQWLGRYLGPAGRGGTQVCLR